MIYTIGHSTREPGEFLDLLAAHRVTQVVDVRRYPASRRHPHFERIAGEVRVATRRRISPHVHHLSDAMGREQVQKLSDFPSRVPDRVDHAGEVSLTAHAVEVRGGLTRPGPALDLTIWLSLTIPHLTSRLPRSPTPRAGRSSRGWPRATRRSRTWRVRFACPSPASINISACSSARGWSRMRNRAAFAAAVSWRGP